MPRSGRRVAFVMAGTLLVPMAGCTFLVSFDDKPVAIADAGAPPVDERAPAAPPPDTGGTADTGAPAPADSGPPPPELTKCDPAFDRGAIEGCVRFEENAQICGDHASFTSYPPSDRGRDVVTCSKARGALCVQHCSISCAHLPDGFPDQCDDCAGKADKLYCGLEMTGWPTKNFNLLLRCTGGRFAADPPPRPCVNGCEPHTEADARCL